VPPPRSEAGWRDDHRESPFFVQLARVFDSHECDRLIGYIAMLGQVQGHVGTDDGAGAKLDREVRRVRETKLLHGPETAWVYERLASAIDGCNRRVFGFDIRECSEDFAIVDYRTGDFFEWHLDIGSGGAATTRKLGVSVMLSSPEEYEGGALAFPGAELDGIPRGDAVVFASFLLHGVRPVKRGRRRALLAWVAGPRFR
jgi:PKHD-type hydroxylase